MHPKPHYSNNMSLRYEMWKCSQLHTDVSLIATDDTKYSVSLEAAAQSSGVLCDVIKNIIQIEQDQEKRVLPFGYSNEVTQIAAETLYDKVPTTEELSKLPQEQLVELRHAVQKWGLQGLEKPIADSITLRVSCFTDETQAMVFLGDMYGDIELINHAVFRCLPTSQQAGRFPWHAIRQFIKLKPADIVWIFEHNVAPQFADVEEEIHFVNVLAEAAPEPSWFSLFGLIDTQTLQASTFEQMMQLYQAWSRVPNMGPLRMIEISEAYATTVRHYSQLKRVASEVSANLWTHSESYKTTMTNTMEESSRRLKYCLAVKKKKQFVQS